MAGFGLDPAGGLRSVLPFLGELGDAIAAAAERGDQLIPLSQTRLGPPITDPPNLFACGANYHAHLAEPGLAMPGIPTLPVIFLKPRSALSGPADPIIRPAESGQLDYEAELAIVIGKAGRRIPASKAAQHIAGYMISNDVSARDLMEGESRQLASPVLLQIMRAKGWDTFLPTGPWLVTADEAGNFEDIRIQTWVNDEPRQDAYAKEMTNYPSQLIEWLSATTTLQPGDIITTGTPAGAGIGMATPKWLIPGDIVCIRMTGLGAMTTPIRQEEPAG
jgi:2-keto-4-pentenoate hydratase/2-oxohepta-3-ene-1,7-dioic acid hydratase in catechol pathway